MISLIGVCANIASSPSGLHRCTQVGDKRLFQGLAGVFAIIIRDLLVNGDNNMSGLTHFNQQGDAHMVDVGEKSVTHRVAVAGGEISLLPETLSMVQAGTHKKGDVLGIARIAGIMGAKKTSDLVPLCHPIGLTHVDIQFEIDSAASLIRCRARTETRSQTGVEMEALAAVQVSLLTIYDMCKAIDRGMTIGSIRLLEKSGGKSGDYRYNEES